jgi:CO/xanthine dehydrogenase FAD-binding subunit
MTDYFFPATTQEAVEMLAACEGRARIIAGGTDILLDIEKGTLTAGQAHAPDCLVDVTRIPELGQIDIEDGWVTCGAAVSFVALREHRYFAAHLHAVVDAAASVGALAIQSAATWVGNLVQAMPAADGAIIAIALDAEVRLVDLDGARWVPVAELYAGPGRSRVDSTRQLVTHIRFPLPDKPYGTAWRRAGRRPSLVLPTLNCATKVVMDGDTILFAAIAMGPVGPCPIRASDAEAYLPGKSPEPAILAEAAQLALCDADPRTSVLRASREYRLTVLPVLVQDALETAVRRAEIDRSCRPEARHFE